MNQPELVLLLSSLTTQPVMTAMAAQRVTSASVEHALDLQLCALQWTGATWLESVPLAHAPIHSRLMAPAVMTKTQTP